VGQKEGIALGRGGVIERSDRSLIGKTFLRDLTQGQKDSLPPRNYQ